MLQSERAINYTVAHVQDFVIIDGRLDWRTMQTLVRSMPDLHKTLILAQVREIEGGDEYIVDEMAIATEHAPFRHRSTIKEVGAQVKKQKIESTPGDVALDADPNEAMAGANEKNADS